MTLPPWSSLTEAALALSPAQWIQSFYVLAAAGCLATAAMPADARKLLADYGARKAAAAPPPKGKDNNNAFVALVAALTSIGQVPHSWFTAFYGLSVAGSLFWAWQFLAAGAVLRGIAARQQPRGPSAALGQVAAVWAMVLLQGARRVYEHAAVVRASRSTMWVVHWVLGLGFYVALSVAVWVEGSGAILLRGKGWEGGWFKVAVAVPVFLWAWVNQYRCHRQLAGLKKYSVPGEGLFRDLVCPHYSCECLLYFSLAIAGAPEGKWLNKTLLCATGFAVVNLGVTAAGTRKWYADKFGQGAVARKWNMIPFVF